MRALIVDDSRSIRTIVGRILRELGFAVVEAVNGRDALRVLAEQAEDQRPTLALIDWNMPEMNGLDLVHAIRMQSRYAMMKLVMVTTESEAAQIGRALDAGADEYVTKPFTREILIEKLAMMGIGADGSGLGGPL